jgi:hypothetical protein
MPDDSNPPPTAAPAPVKTSGLAITSLVLGILGLFTCGLMALPGLILGIIALVKINNNKATLKGFGLALAGTIVSGVFLMMLPVWLALFLPALAAAKSRAQTIACVNNEKQLALAVRMYAGEHSEHFPPAATWCDAIKPETGSVAVFKCPSANPTSRCDYAFNSALDGMDDSKVDPQTVMIFESDGGWNASGGADSMVTPARHQNGRIYVVAYADGSVQEVPQSELGSLRWNP